jgi:cellulose synthase/poly-beta-1,6-N-acetylglucosamine synthase-like glycosyltransferase
MISAAVSFLLYTPKLVQFCYAFRRAPRAKAKDKRRIALVIPALNESKVIGDLFDSIDRQDYDRDLLEINVIIKDEADPTAEMARTRGYRVTVVPEQTCKGEALHGFFTRLDKERFRACDAFVIVDADAVLAPDYVTELNNALEYNRQIFISRKFIKNYLGDRSARTVFSNCSALTYPMLDDLGNNYRMRHDIPMNMCGQGLMVRREVIEQIGGWPYRSLTEDYELKLDSVLRGFTSMYYPYAVIYTEEALRHKESYSRRLRWVTGYSQCDKKYKKQIRAQLKTKGGSGAQWFEYVFALVPLILFATVTVCTMLTGAGFAAYYAVKGIRLVKKTCIRLIAIPFGVMYLLLFLYCCLAMAAYRDVFAPLSAKEKAGTLLFAPLFMLEYFPIFIQSRVRAKKGMQWQPTEHIVYEKTEEKNRK